MSANRECLGWDYMRPESRLAVLAHTRGINLNRHALVRMSTSEWWSLTESERKAIYRVDWKFVLASIPLVDRVSAIVPERAR